MVASSPTGKGVEFNPPNPVGMPIPLDLTPPHLDAPLSLFSVVFEFDIDVINGTLPPTFTLVHRLLYTAGRPIFAAGVAYNLPVPALGNPHTHDLVYEQFQTPPDVGPSQQLYWDVWCYPATNGVDLQVQLSNAVLTYAYDFKE